jgi:ATP-dependent Clp protease adaptor protein ClpS
VGLEIIGLIAAGAASSYGWWKLQQRRERKLLDIPRDADLEVVLGVAQHEATARGHAYLWPLHLLYGLAQDESFVAAITRLEGDAARFEAFVHDELDKHGAALDETAMHEGAHVLGYTLGSARAHGRAATTVDLWARLARTDIAKAAALAAKVDATALLFLLAHGTVEPAAELAGRTDVHVVLRNDDYTTRDFVVEILRDVFELGDDDATARMEQTHGQGRAIVGRYKLALARDRVEAVRRRAREQGFPLWIGVEDC